MEPHIFFDETRKRLRYTIAISVLTGVFFTLLFAVKTFSFFVEPEIPKAEISNTKESTDAELAIEELLWQQDKEYNKQQHQNLQQQLASREMKNYKPEMRVFYVNWDERSFESLSKNVEKIDVLVPEWLHLSGSEGDFVLNNPKRQEETLEIIKDAGVDLKITPLINNYSSKLGAWDDASLSVMLQKKSSREKMIENLFLYVKKNEFDGINIDFENIPPSQQLNYQTFIRELSVKFHEDNLEVSMSVPLDNPEFDVKQLTTFADLVYLMAYDQHTISNNSPGPIASQIWYSEALAQRFKTLDPSKTIVALGNYGYDWAGSVKKSNHLSFQQALALSKESEKEIRFDPISGNLAFKYKDKNNIIHHVWFMDSASYFNQMVIGNKLGAPRGYALWRIGAEDPSLWNLFEGADNPDMNVVKKIETIPHGDEVSHDGMGEVLRVTETPHDGKREIELNESNGLIEDEKFVEYSSSYNIQRLGDPGQKRIVLTFDDGPDAFYTAQILDVLKQYDVKATFFVIGLKTELNRNLVERIVNEGHEIGSHTYSHPEMSSISRRKLAFELNATERAIEAITGRKTLLFRPPYGEDIEPANSSEIGQLTFTSKKGYYTIGINIDPKDWKDVDAEEISKRVIEQALAGKGQIVLLHDGGGDREETIAALPMMIEGLREEGFKIVSIGELIGVEREVLMPPLKSEVNLTTGMNSASITTISTISKSLHFLFLFGILLGIARVLFVGALALYHRFMIENKKNVFKRKSKFLPRVSVIVPAWNEEKVVVKTVNSILKSTYKRFDIIVIDDGSTDNTYRIAKKSFCGNPKVRVLKTPQNGGKSKALNFGISKTRSSIIVVIDADTILKADAISRLVGKFYKKNIAAVAGNAKVGNRRNILTRWQALEYMTAQNLDRRAQDVINGISVVPGAIGAWKRSALMKVGGFTPETLAEDADLTLKLLRKGYRVTFENEAIAYTEAPDTVRIFLKQRFRWMFGTLQVVWKNKDTMFRKKYGAIGFYVVPNAFVFQIFFPLISPLMDLMLVLSITWTMFQHHHHPLEFPSNQIYSKMFLFYMLFLLIDFVVALIPFFLEKKEDWKLLLWQPLQRFFYRQLMYYIAIKSITVAICGSMVGWGKRKRKATVTDSLIEDSQNNNLVTEITG